MQTDIHDAHNGFGTIRVYPDKTPIYHQGDSATRIFRVNSGVVMTFRLLEDSRRQITGFCTEGEFFGLSPHGDHMDGAVTVTSAGIQSVSISALETDAGLRAQIMNHSFRKIEDTQNLMMTLTKTSSEARVAAFLVMLADRRLRRQGPNADGLEVSLPMSRLDIADYLGLSRETVSRRLNELKSLGLIGLPDTHTAQINRFDGLRRCAGMMAA
ncbi:transcriptional regulator [Algimonas arctica]|uniref:Transcriptional regulator n=1 Tax=Algimonas arctica TaxID=1479486 RepID=A0A8J3CMA1_9PROT|nr:helix-turn-helix domain-containing protein [Algimonas arctica]GHA86106.1 transcriptional regulator [Algimonas arctica]